LTLLLPASFNAFAAPSFLGCPQMLSFPAAARLCHTRRWLVVASLFATYFCCTTPAFVDARHLELSTLLSPAAFVALLLPAAAYL